MDRGAWRALVHGVTELDMTEATEHTHVVIPYSCCFSCYTLVLKYQVSHFSTRQNLTDPLLLFSHDIVFDSATPWIVALQTPLPWDFPGKKTGMGCHFLLQGMLRTPG